MTRRCRVADTRREPCPGHNATPVSPVRKTTCSFRISSISAVHTVAACLLLHARFAKGKVMSDTHFPGPEAGPPYHQMAGLLGTNGGASAIAVHLHRDRCGVVLSHDPAPPVIRRKMAFHDALYDDAVTVDGVEARRADTGIEIRSLLRTDCAVIITELGLLDLIVVRSLDLL